VFHVSDARDVAHVTSEEPTAHFLCTIPGAILLRTPEPENLILSWVATHDSPSGTMFVASGHVNGDPPSEITLVLPLCMVQDAVSMLLQQKGVREKSGDQT